MTQYALMYDALTPSAVGAYLNFLLPKKQYFEIMASDWISHFACQALSSQNPTFAGRQAQIINSSFE